MVNRNDIVLTARQWIGTRFHHQGRLKKKDGDKGGVDCIGFVLGVADELGLTYNGVKLSKFDRRDYPKVPNGSLLKDEFSKYLNEIELSKIDSGDVLMFKFDENPQHVGIVVKEKGDYNIIHCHMQARGVVEHKLDECWKRRIVTAFKFLD